MHLSRVPVPQHIQSFIDNLGDDEFKDQYKGHYQALVHLHADVQCYLNNAHRALEVKKDDAKACKALKNLISFYELILKG